MNMTASDLELLQQYARRDSEEAFAALVSRHLDLVYSVALRQVRSPQLAEEVAQSVFADLARNIHKLKPDTILTAWLHQVTRRTAISVVRRESRRQYRETIASEMTALNTLNADSGTGFQPIWPHIEPLLEQAMDSLDDTDRSAILLRYFENKSLREVGQALGTSDDAAQKRVSRAVDRLREFFAKRGVTVGASGLVVVLSANAIQAAPAGFAISVSTTAGTTALSSATVTKGTAGAKATAAAILTSAIVSQKVIATHFDLEGRPDIWMNRSTYLVFSVALGIGLPLLLIGLGYVVRFLPVNSINIPNRNYWLAPERRVVTFDFLFRHLLWLACFEAIFMIGVHLLIADANRQVPPHLSLPLFWGVFGSGLTFVAIWLGVLLRRFRRDMSGRNCVPLK